ncbi:hypothetical protein [Chitinophaga dinghuensis]|nr:hypothetical protein [Chitinophaga dinghuensis]
MKKFIDEAKERMASPTPGFFKKIKIAGKVLMAGSGAILAPAVADVHMPGVLMEIAKGLFIAGSVMVAVAAVAVEGE